MDMIILTKKIVKYFFYKFTFYFRKVFIMANLYEQDISSIARS
jgi:hypothetical protein